MDDFKHSCVGGVYEYLDSLDDVGRRDGAPDWRTEHVRPRFRLLAIEWGLVEPVESEERFRLTSNGHKYLGVWADELASPAIVPPPVEELVYNTGLHEFLRDLELGERWVNAFEEPAAAERRKAEIGDEDLTDTVWEWMGEPDLPDRKFFDLACRWHLVDRDPGEMFDVFERYLVSINQRGLAYLALWSDRTADTTGGATKTQTANDNETPLPFTKGPPKLVGDIVMQRIRDSLYKHHVVECEGELSIKNADNPLKQKVICEQIMEKTDLSYKQVKGPVSTKFTELFLGKKAKKRTKKDESGYDLYLKMCKMGESTLFNWFLGQFDMGLAKGVLGNWDLDEDSSDIPVSEAEYQGEDRSVLGS